MTYREHPPPPSLRPYVECAWTSTASSGAPFRVLPDGCVDAIFDLGRVPARGSRAPRHYAVGTMTEAVVFHPPGAIDLVGVRLRPGTGRLAFGVAACGLTDGIAPLDDLWGRPASRLAERMADATLAERLDRLWEELGTRLLADRDTGALARAGCRAFERSDPGRAVAALASELGVGRRRLERAFRRDVGLSPARLRSVLRFRRAVSLLTADPSAPLTRVALNSGYYDQPHFTREFRRWAGVPPTAWLAERAGVASVQDENPLPR